MKPSHILVSLRRLSAGRITFTLASCVAAAAVAIAAPPRLISSSNPNVIRGTQIAPIDVPSGPGNQPVSMDAAVQVMVELDAPAGATLYAEEVEKVREQMAATRANKVPMSAAARGEMPRIEVDAAGTARVQSHLQAIDAAQQALLPAIANVGGEVTFRTQRAFNGIAVRVSPDKVAELAKLPGVKAVRPMVAKYPTAFQDIDFLGTRGPNGFWNKSFAQGVGLHGEGVKVAVIDTGVDYTHANFGGPGQPNYAGIGDKTPVPNAYYPSAKVVNGYDFAGDNYSASGEPGTTTTPQPDPNPKDANGHGTACASLVGGYGVNFGGTRYQGNYDDNTPINAMKIAPGHAPQSQIVAVRVFGAQGSTFLTTQGIDFAMDPNGDGNFNDHVDIISMSLGSNNGSPDDDSAVASSNAVAIGTVVVCSAGNAGDTFYITGSPGSATGVIATAASYNDQAGFIADAVVEANSPAILRGNKAPGIWTTNSSRGTVSGEIVQMLPNDSPSATTPVSNAANLAGKIAYWDRVPGQGANAAARAKSAGAIGMVIGADQSGNGGFAFLLNTGATTPQIPEIVIPQKDGQFIKSFSNFNQSTGVAQNPINVTIRSYDAARNDPQVVSGQGVSADTMPTYSSRGPQLETNNLKPDLTAPAEVVGVALTGTGNGVANFNGTSSACPHVSGGMALLKQLHPDWSVRELVAGMMNTSTNDLFVESGTAGASPKSNVRRAVSRVGTGRVDFLKASQTNVVAFNSTDFNQTNISFGSIEVPADGSVAISKNLTLRNKGTSSVTYNLSYSSVSTVGDANYSAPSGQVTVPANGEFTFPVLFRATGSTLRHNRDASTSNGQSVAGNAANNSASGAATLGREWLSEAAGYAVFTPTTAGQPSIRVALWANPKPASAMRVTNTSYNPGGANTGTFNVNFTGVGLNTGNSLPIDIVSLARIFELQYVHPNAGNLGFSSDPDVIKYVGISSDYNNQPASNKRPTVITWAIEGFGNASAPSFISSDKEIFVDVNGDGIDEWAIFLNSRRIAGTTSHSNVYYPTVQNLNTGANRTQGIPTNLLASNQADVNAMNNSVVLVGIPASELGYTGQGQSSFFYQVAAYDSRTGDLQDVTPYLRYDIANPGMIANGNNLEPFYYFDLPGVSVPVNYNGANYQSNGEVARNSTGAIVGAKGSLGAMVVHRHNAFGNRVDVITVRTPKIFNFTPDQGPVGTFVQIQGENFHPGTDVRFSPNVQASQIAVLSNRTISCRVPPGAVTGPITVSDAGGADTSEEVFTVTPPPDSSPSPSPSPQQSPTARTPQTYTTRGSAN